jgi:hypothetical protein
MKLLLFITLIISGQSFAQSFYIKPKFEHKTYHGSTNWPDGFYKFSVFNKGFNNDFIPNDYLHVKSKALDFRSIYTIGVNAGVTFDNSNRFEFGWNQDATGSTFSFSDARNLTTKLNTGLQTAILNHRFEFLFFKTLYTNEKEDKFLHLDNVSVVFGAGIKFQNVPKKNELGQNDYLANFRSFSDEPNYVFADHYIYGLNRFSTFFSLGFSTDLSYKKAYLFSLSLTYLQGNFTLENTRHYLSIIENNIEVATYSYNTYSRGSGIQFQISRRLQFYPWKKLEKKKARNKK